MRTTKLCGNNDWLKWNFNKFATKIKDYVVKHVSEEKSAAKV